MTGPEPGTHFGAITRTAVMYRPDIRTYFERITPNNQKQNRRFWKSFQHYKCWSDTSSAVSPGGAHITADMSDSNKYLDVAQCNEPYVLCGTGYGPAGIPLQGLPDFYVPLDSGGFIPSPISLDDCIAWSLKSMLPTIKGQLSLLNTLYEFKDVVSVKRSARLAINTFKQLKSKIAPKYARNSLRMLSHLSSDVYLQLKFNVLPLISDVQGMYRALSNYKKRINDLISRSGRTRTSHFTKFLNEYDANVDSGDGANHGLGYCYYGSGTYPTVVLVSDRRQVITHPTIFHAEIQYNYNYTDYQRVHAHVLALLDAVGVNLNPAIIWNALPWSFVVDWVVNLSSFLDSLKEGNMEPKINILQYSWSVSRRRDIFLSGKVAARKYYSGYDSTTYYPKEYISYPAVHETAYRRQVGLPNMNLLLTSGLSLTELSLGAALVLPMVTRHKRRRKH